MPRAKRYFFTCYNTHSDFQWTLKLSHGWFVLLGFFSVLIFCLLIFKLPLTINLVLGTSFHSIRENDWVTKITLWNVANLTVTADGDTDQVKFKAKLLFTSSRISLYNLFKSLKKHKPPFNQSILHGDNCLKWAISSSWYSQCYCPHKYWLILRVINEKTKLQ